MKTVRLPAGDRVPAFGQGTWMMGEDAAKRQAELATLRRGIELGATLIDTAEMYGDGKAEELVGRAIAGCRDDIFLVSKVYPHNATRRGAVAACERSLKRLATDRLDLYLLHWRGSVPLKETLDAFAKLRDAGKIRHYGVSNLDLADMQELSALPGGADVQTDQVLYNLTRRGIEWDLLPWLRTREIAVMAYSPIEQGRLLRNRGLVDFARQLGATPAQIALAWLLRNDNVIVIPKASNPARLEENLAALELTLTPEQLAEIDRIFPPPRSPQALQML
jgi:diketogulonate reductase-like aldo/keto reductase